MQSAALLELVTAATSCYTLPVWRGAVVVHPLERASITRCGTSALTREGEKSITREPYLQSTTTTQTVVAWGSARGRGEVVLREPGGDVVASIAALYVGDPSRRKDRLAAQNPRGGRWPRTTSSSWQPGSRTSRRITSTATRWSTTASR